MEPKSLIKNLVNTKAMRVFKADDLGSDGYFPMRVLSKRILVLGDSESVKDFSERVECFPNGVKQHI